MGISKYKSYIVPIITFIAIWIYQIYFNKYELILRSLPDEMGAMALAAKLVGYDWSEVLKSQNSYYGFGQTFFFLPLFALIKNPIILYQALLAVGAFLRTLPVFFVFSICRNHKKEISDYTIAVIAIICVLITPTFALNIDNEPMIILTGWTIFYLIIQLQNTKGIRHKIDSALLAIVLDYALICHTRALLYMAAILFILIFYHILMKKKLVDYIFFLAFLIPLYVLAQKAINYVQILLYQSNTATTVYNTGLSLSASITASGTFFKVSSLLKIAATNILAIYIWGLGLVFFGILFIGVIDIKSLKKFIKENGSFEILMFASLFVLLVFLGGFLGVCIIWIWSVNDILQKGQELTRGMFYLRYYGMVFGEIFLIFYLWIDKVQTKAKRLLIYFFYFISFLFIFICQSVLRISTANGRLNGDWFGFFGALSLREGGFNLQNQDVFYYLSAVLAVCIIFFIFYTFYMRGKETIAICIVALIIAYQYGYHCVTWDNQFSSEYLKQVDKIYDLKINCPNIWNDVDSVYYVGGVAGLLNTQYIMQEIVVHPDLDIDEDDVCIIFSEYENIIDIFDMMGYYKGKLGDNQYIITNNTDVIDMLKVYNIQLIAVK